MKNRVQVVTSLALLMLGIGPSSAVAGIHTWDVSEVFSNADGTIQFVEFVEAGGGNFETGISGGSTSSTAGPKSFSWTGAPVTNTANKRYLVGSQTFANLTGAPPVDAIMPLSVLPFFFQPASDTVNFAVYDSCTFTAIPTNGIGSRDCVTNTNQTSNSPTNYAGTPGSVKAAIAQGSLDNFQNATLQNWAGGTGGGGSLPTNQPNGGPAGVGDRYLQLTATSNLLGSFNKSQWAGDYVAAAVEQIDVDLNNFGPDPVSVRITLFTPGCDGLNFNCTAWTSTNATVLSSGSGWVGASFSIAEADLTRVLGSATYTASLQNIERIAIRHDDGAPSPPGTGSFVSATLGVDNVLPEPSRWMGLVIGAAVLGALRRRRRATQH